MSSLLTKMFKPNSQHPLAIVQYERAGYSVGREEELHWAIVAVTSHKDEGNIKGPVWQVMDLHWNDGRPVEWRQHHADIGLNKTMKCLGGVYIGEIARKDVDKLSQIIVEQAQPIPKFRGWNCRDWVMEVIRGILIPHGWAVEGITLQQSLLPSMRVAARASVDAREEYNRPMPILVDLQP
ncbi:hypothetical protein C8Q77DRAFT_1055788 [Trametes polyzona]|nr:hypothetical protein C8Q77DRAFT_1055788 [Trametes polyzona]